MKRNEEDLNWIILHLLFSSKYGCSVREMVILTVQQPTEIQRCSDNFIIYRAIYLERDDINKVLPVQGDLMSQV
jgi:hypothetical protein